MPPPSRRGRTNTRRRTEMPFALRIAVTNAWVSQLFDEEMAKKGVAPFQAGVLMMVWLHEPVTPTGLESVMGLAGTTLRDRLRELTRADLVERVPNAEDGRSYFLQTTPAGAEAARLSMTTTRRLSRLLERNGVDDLAGLERSLDTVRAVSKDLIAGDLRTGPGSRSSGPW